MRAAFSVDGSKQIRFEKLAAVDSIESGSRSRGIGGKSGEDASWILCIKSLRNL
jgi:hypothetical protein